jgi:hypothetical protein
MPSLGFEHTIPPSERAKTVHVLYRAATPAAKKNTVPNNLKISLIFIALEAMIRLVPISLSYMSPGTSSESDKKKEWQPTANYCL